MPWCPICKNEYKEGFEICADCGNKLVESLEVVDSKIDARASHHIQDSFVFIEKEALADMELNNAFADLIEGREDFFPESTDADEFRQNVKHDNRYKPFVKAKDRAEEYKASGYSLLFVGIIGIVFLILSVFNVIPSIISINIKSVGFIAMLIIFVGFTIIGLKSFIEAKTISALGDAEDELVDNIQSYILNGYTKESIDAICLNKEDMNLSNELKFFKREETIKNLIYEKFGEVDSALLDNQVEYLFNKIFEE